MTIERLRAAADACQDSRLAAWLGTVASRLDQGLTPSLALDLTGPGALHERDRLLRQAALLLSAPTRWQAAGELSQRIRSAPRRRDTVDRLLQHAARAAHLPAGQRRLYDIIASEPTEPVALQSPPIEIAA